MTYTKICLLCGKQFETSRKLKLYCDDVHTRKCAICGNVFVITSKDGPMTCSKPCATKFKVQQRKVVTKVCAICGEEFQTQQSFQTICKKDHFRECTICKKSFRVDGNNLFQVTCGDPQCKQEQTRRTNIEKFGVANPSQASEIKEKKRQTFQERYGVDSSFQIPGIQDQIKATLIQRYGADNALKSEMIRGKMRATNLERYGAENPFQSEQIKAKIRDTLMSRYGGVGFGSATLLARVRQTMKNRYGFENAMQSEEIRHRAEETNLQRYGARHYLQTEEGKQKVRATMVDRYGAPNIMQSEEGRMLYQTACLLKYGTSYAIGSEEVQEKIRETNQAKRGVDYPFQSEEVQSKIVGIFLDHYGVENPLLSDEVRAKIKATVQELYGVDNVLSAPEIREKITQTNLERYGVENVFQAEKVKEKSKSTLLDKYGEDHYSKTQEFRDKRAKTIQERFGGLSPLASEEIRQKCIDSCEDRYGVPWPCMTEQCRKAYRTISKVNRLFADMLESLGIEYEFEFPIGDKSYDIRVGKTLIEINPTITHNSYMSIFDPTSSGYKSDYHNHKRNIAVDAGYRCICVWDWDSWDDIISMVQPKEIIYARKCIVKKISKKEVETFTDANHLSGSCRGQNIAYGLLYNDELVSVMSFGKPRYNDHYDYELLRFCSLPSIRIVGGASKLFKTFTSEHYGSIISYCDRSKFDGSVYQQIGMAFVQNTEPAKIWSKGSKYVTTNLLNQRGYDQLFGTNYGKGTSNEQLMLNDGWLPVYDCGQAVFEYRGDEMV